MKPHHIILPAAVKQAFVFRAGRKKLPLRRNPPVPGFPYHNIKMQQNGTYINSLTGFRFLAASLVFVYHNRKYWRYDIPPEMLRFINECHIGVSLFFVLSGFLIAYVYSDGPLATGRSYFRYLMLRVARIMPLYWLILTTYYLDPAFGNFAFRFDTYSLFHAFSGKTNLYGIAQAWSLNVEMSFYVLAPFLCLLMRKNLKMLIVSLVVLFLLTVASGVLWQSINGNPTRYFSPAGFVANSTFAGRSFQFLAGMLLAGILRNGDIERINRFRGKTITGFCLIVAITYAIGLFQRNIFVSGTETLWGMLLHDLLLPVAIAIAIAGLITEKTLLGSLFASRLLVLLGNASFAFYLIHISYVNLRLCRLIIMPDRNFVLLWCLSVALYLWVEKPVHDYLRRLITRLLPLAPQQVQSR
jgi:peptidoglycan/LPS O-acetylase OafA/YrhL